MAGISDKRHSVLDRTFFEDIQEQPDRPFRDLLAENIAMTSIYVLSGSEAARWHELSRNIDGAFIEKFDTVISECKQSGQWKKFRDEVAQHIRHESETKTILAPEFFHRQGDDDTITKSWNEPFRGQSADVLKRTIINHANKPFQDQKLYSNSMSIVQSSGTGKSRLLDELAFTMPVVSLNTRPAPLDGFPAADSAARKFFTLTDWDEAERRYLAFLFALFEVLYDYLSFKLNEKLEPDQKTWPIPMKLRHLMTFKQEYLKQGPLRVEFYDAVILKATDHLTVGRPISEESLLEKANALDVFLPSGMPLILAIDEVHGLVGSHHELGFIHLRRQLNKIVSSNRIFTVFLSTMGKIQTYMPPILSDPSARRHVKGLSVLPPFTAVGFDQLAYRSVKANDLKMDRIILDEFMCQMGRPLFGSRFNHGTKSVKDGILGFAAQKLLGGGQMPTHSLPAAATLACLATRLALPFHTTSLDQQLQQVEQNLRICITIKEDMETAVTVAASEPIVAEASALLTSSLRQTKSLAKMLKDTLHGTPSLDLGDRGEMVGLLLLTMTRDVLVYPPGNSGSIRPDKRSIPLVMFLKTLLSIENLEKALPVNVVDGGKGVPFGETFEHSRIHFNHFIKATDYDVINRKYLWKVASRAAGILCARNQLGVDAILVGVLDHRKPLGPDNIVIILFQMKNNVKMKAQYKGRLFHVMDPYLLGIFDESEGSCSIPVIRLVFALASSQSTAYALEPRNPSRSGGSNVKSKKTTFTSFDIWAAGATKGTFPVIENDSSTFGELLQRDGYWSAHYQPLLDEPPETEALKRSLNPASCSNPHHWAFTEMEAHDYMMVDPNPDAEAAKMERDSDVEEEQSEKEAMEVS